MFTTQVDGTICSTSSSINQGPEQELGWKLQWMASVRLHSASGSRANAAEIFQVPTNQHMSSCPHTPPLLTFPALQIQDKIENNPKTTNGHTYHACENLFPKKMTVSTPSLFTPTVDGSEIRRSPPGRYKTRHK